MGFGITASSWHGLSELPDQDNLLCAFSLRSIVAGYGNCISVTDSTYTANWIIGFDQNGNVNKETIQDFADAHGISGNTRHAKYGDSGAYIDGGRLPIKGPRIMKDGAFCESAGRPSLYFDGYSSDPKNDSYEFGSQFALPISSGESEPDAWLPLVTFLTGVVFTPEEGDPGRTYYNLFDGDYSYSGYSDRRNGFRLEMRQLDGAGTPCYLRGEWTRERELDTTRADSNSVYSSVPLQWSTPYYAFHSLTKKTPGGTVVEDIHSVYLNSIQYPHEIEFYNTSIQYNGDYSNDLVNLGTDWATYNSGGIWTTKSQGAFRGHMQEFFLYKDAEEVYLGDIQDYIDKFYDIATSVDK